MHFETRLPAIPLIVNDPYFSIWMPGNTSTSSETAHWSGVRKQLRGYITVDGKLYRYLGKDGKDIAETLKVEVTPTKTRFTLRAGSVDLIATFWSPTITDDLDVLSTPITFIDLEAAANDGLPHDIRVTFTADKRLCYDGDSRPALYEDAFTQNGVNVAFCGQSKQKVLSNSGDLISIDWGYLFLASHQRVRVTPGTLEMIWETQVAAQAQRAFAAIGYDDIAAINYFGVPCRAWYQRSGRTFQDALYDFVARHDELLAAATAMDERVVADALKAGNEDYARVLCAAWRQTFGAHKLIATPDGEMAFLSKENNSGGCIGTVDVSYPTLPVLLKYCPELINGFCRPIFHFASLPVWSRDYAPHDVGFYPYATGQVYGYRAGVHTGDATPPLYLYPKGADLFNDTMQMPVEECGNMLIMLEAALTYGASDALVRRYADTLALWVGYLDRHGDDPAEQLCTDDFAGHLARNINLSAKATVGVACYARLLRRLGDEAGAAKWEARAHEMAENWLSRSGGVPTHLTFDGIGWSMKYNLVWDKLLDLHLLPDDFYKAETESYLPRINRYGLPLDSRAAYTKSDWICWCAAMTDDPAVRDALLQPLTTYLHESATRVAFSDWYDTVSGDYVEFIARSVQGGLWMPVLRPDRA